MKRLVIVVVTKGKLFDIFYQVFWALLSLGEETFGASGKRSVNWGTLKFSTSGSQWWLL